MVETFAAPGLWRSPRPGTATHAASCPRPTVCAVSARSASTSISSRTTTPSRPRKGTIRGLHFQVPPHEQGKLVRVLRGAIVDVVVDIRRGSPAFGRRDRGRAFRGELAPALCAARLRPRLLYAHPGRRGALPDDASTTPPEADRGLAFDDPDLAIEWPVEPSAAILSDKDRRHPRLRDLPAYFSFEPVP